MKPIKDFEQQYTITPHGTVIRLESGRALASTVNKQNGYPYVSLWKHNVGKNCAVHRLVAEAYLPNPENKPNVNHKNSIRTDAHVDNLEWCTQAENIQHGYTHGFMSQDAKKNFADFELDVLLRAVLAGETMTAIATAQGVGVPRLTINLRKRAVVMHMESLLIAELANQKRIRNTQANVHKRRPVLQHTLNGTFIREHASLHEAAKSLNRTSTGSISNALNPAMSQGTAYGFIWTYK